MGNCTRCPELAIKYLDATGPFQVPFNNETQSRWKVRVLVEFRDENIANYMKIRMCDFEEQTPLQYITSMFFTTKDEVGLMMNIKYNKTVSRWDNERQSMQVTAINQI